MKARTTKTPADALPMAVQSTDLQVLESLGRAQLHAHATRYYKSGGQTEPEVALVVYGDACAVLKDYARTPGWFSRIITLLSCMSLFPLMSPLLLSSSSRGSAMFSCDM